MRDGRMEGGERGEGRGGREGEGKCWLAAPSLPFPPSLSLPHTTNPCPRPPRRGSRNSESPGGLPRAAAAPPRTIDPPRAGVARMPGGSGSAAARRACRMPSGPGLSAARRARARARVAATVARRESRLERAVSPWLWFKIRLGTVSLGGCLSLCSYRRRRAAVQQLWRTRQPVTVSRSRCNKAGCPRLGGGARSAGRIKHVWTGVMAARMGRPLRLARRPHRDRLHRPLVTGTRGGPLGQRVRVRICRCNHWS